MIKKIKTKIEDWTTAHADEIIITSFVVAVGSSALASVRFMHHYYHIVPKSKMLLELSAENAALLKNVGGAVKYETKLGEFFLLHATSLGM